METDRIMFGDTQLISDIKNKRTKKIETMKITIDLKSLLNIGIKRDQALVLLKKLLKK